MKLVIFLFILSLKCFDCFSMDEKFVNKKFNLSNDDQLFEFDFELVDDRMDSYFYTWEYKVVVSNHRIDLYYQKLINENDKKNSYSPNPNLNTLFLFDKEFYYVLMLNFDQAENYSLIIMAHRNTEIARNLTKIFKSNKIDSESYKGDLKRNVDFDKFDQKDVLFNYINFADEKLLLTAFSKSFDEKKITKRIVWTFQISEVIEKKLDEKKYFKEPNKWGVRSSDTSNLYHYLGDDYYISLAYKIKMFENKTRIKFSPRLILTDDSKNSELDKKISERNVEKVIKLIKDIEEINSKLKKDIEEKDIKIKNKEKEIEELNKRIK